MGNLQQNGNSMSSQQTMMNSMQPTSSLDQVQTGSGTQVNMNPMVSLQPNQAMLHIKQQEQLLQNQQLKQFQNRQMQQTFLHKQQLMQQQQQQFRQQGNQVNQMGQQLHESNDMKLRQQQQQQQQQMGVKPGTFQNVAGQRAGYHQQMKPGGPFSPQLMPPGGGSPQISQHASPQIEGGNMFNKPMHSNSPFAVPSPSTPSASPLPGELMGGVSSVISGGTMGGHGVGHGHGQVGGAVLPSQSLAIGTPGISASPLLAELDGMGVVASIGAGKASGAELPLERLLKAVKSISPNALSASVNDIGSVVSMIDRIAGSAPGNGSRAAVGEDLVAMTKCRLQARTFVTQDGTNAIRKMKRFTSAMPLNVVSSAGSLNDSFKHLTGAETSELDSTASSAIKRPRIETNHALLEEIKEINRGLIDTVVDISEEDVDPAAASAASEGADGTVVKCSFSAVALGPNLKSQYASAQMSPIQPLRLLVPANYPNSSPILLDKFPVEISKEFEDLSVKAKSRFSISLRSLSQPMSLKEIARTWDICARAVISEYAQQSGGGTFSSKYGTWENCLSAA